MNTASIASLLLMATLVLGVTPTPAQQPGDTVELVKCYDGDTCTFNGLSDTATQTRLKGIDTPERYGPCPELAEVARNRLVNRLHNAATITAIPTGTGVYGRTLIWLFADGQHINQWLINTGLATRWPHHEPCPEAS